MTSVTNDLVVADVQGGPSRSLWARHENMLLGLLAVAAFMLFWEFSVVFGWVNPLFTSSPTRICGS